MEINRIKRAGDLKLVELEGGIPALLDDCCGLSVPVGGASDS